MIVYFKVGNYKSIKAPVVINFNASSISEHTDSNIITSDGLDLLRSILLYGHNASGKSKILDALGYCRRCILHSVNEEFAQRVATEPFKLSEETKNKPSLFEVCFVVDNVKYRYGFEIDNEKVHKEYLLESKLPLGKEFDIFLRIEDKFKIDHKRFENAEGIENRTRSNALFLSVASQWNVAKARGIVQWFREIQVMHGLTDHQFPDATISYMNDPKMATIIKELINRADLGINDIGLDKNVKNVTTTQGVTKDGTPILFKTGLRVGRENVITYHTKFDSDNKPDGNVEFSLAEQGSEGANKFFSIIGRLLFAIHHNQLVVIDEFDARLHPLLSKAIIKLFNSNQSTSKAQLLVVTHDTALLDRKLLRRDQIYFVSKNEFGASEVTALVEYKTRKESPYDKNYLEGKYGAIPIIEEFESLLNDEQA